MLTIEARVTGGAVAVVAVWGSSVLTDWYSSIDRGSISSGSFMRFDADIFFGHETIL
jgi:hypothetical protein